MLPRSVTKFFVNLFCMFPCTDCPRKANRRLSSLVFKQPLTPCSNDMSVGQMRWLVPMKSLNLSTYTRLSGVHLRLRKRTTCLIQFYLVPVPSPNFLTFLFPLNWSPVTDAHCALVQGTVHLPGSPTSKKADPSFPSSQELSTALQGGRAPPEPLSHPRRNDWLVWPCVSLVEANSKFLLLSFTL